MTFLALKPNELRDVIHKVNRLDMERRKLFYRKLFKSIDVKKDVTRGVLEMLIETCESDSLFELSRDLSFMLVIGLLHKINDDK